MKQDIIQLSGDVTVVARKQLPFETNLRKQSRYFLVAAQRFGRLQSDALESCFGL